MTLGKLRKFHFSLYSVERSLFEVEPLGFISDHSLPLSFLLLFVSLTSDVCTNWVVLHKGVWVRTEITLLIFIPPQCTVLSQLSRTYVF